MSSNLHDLLETLVSGFVDIGGQATIHGGKGLMVGAASKIGWAKKSADTGPKRFGGHKVSGHSLSNNSLGQRRNLHNYNPQKDYQTRSKEAYNQAMMCGSGVVRFNKERNTAPRHLYGRSSFNAPKPARSGPSGSFSKNPRGFINFNKR